MLHTACLDPGSASLRFTYQLVRQAFSNGIHVPRVFYLPRVTLEPPAVPPSPATLTVAPAEAAGTEGSPGTGWEGSWELPEAPLLCRAQGEMKMCWKCCKSAFPRAEIGDTLESCISPVCSSAPMNISPALPLIIRSFGYPIWVFVPLLG